MEHPNPQNEKEMRICPPGLVEIKIAVASRSVRQHRFCSSIMGPSEEGGSFFCAHNGRLCSAPHALLFVDNGTPLPKTQLNGNGIFYPMRAGGDIIAAVV